MNRVKYYKVLHYMDSPSDVQRWTEQKLIQEARDAVTNGQHEGPAPQTAAEAIEILHDIGDVQIADGGYTNESR